MRAFLERLKPREGSAFFCRERRDAAFPFAWHYHPEFELTLIVRSEGKRFVGDHIADYRDGDLVLIGPNVPHSWASRSGMHGEHVAIVIQFGDDIFGKGGAAALGRGPFERLIANSLRGVSFPSSAARELTPRLVALPALQGLRQLGELLLVLDALAHSGKGQALSSRVMASDFVQTQSHPIDGVIRFMSERYQGRVRVDEAARVAGLSVSAFCRFFKRHDRTNLRRLSQRDTLGRGLPPPRRK